ncbi:hypothetical protein [Actinoplanes nipponensis]|nr:hypothetical protein [Actinoplanes nipponensis]
MATWTAMAGTHQFTADDEPSATAAAGALCAYGFAKVTADPARLGPGWTVTAWDEGPYPVDAVGHRQIEAVADAAAAVVRAHGVRADGGTRCDPAMLQTLRDRRTAAVTRENPGARPPVPEIVLAPAPPSAPLPLVPDTAADGEIALPGLRDVRWAELSHAHGPAEDIPDLLLALADPDGDWDDTLDELFGDNLLHQGTCYPATAAALPFLTRLIRSGALPAGRRLDLYVWLLVAADGLLADLVADAGTAEVTGAEPRPGPWAPEVHAAVGDQVAALVTRWDDEPPRIRLVLACLAALFPERGGALAAGMAALAAEHAGTSQGAFLSLAHALISGADGRAEDLAAGIVAWDDSCEEGWLRAPGLPVAVRAGHVLADGVLRVL